MSTVPAGAATTEVADLVAAAALAVPGVAGLHTGAFGEVATYLPGRRVNGVRVREDLVEVHVCVVHGISVLDTARAIRAAVAPVVDTPVLVAIEDVVPPPTPDM